MYYSIVFCIQFYCWEVSLWANFCSFEGGLLFVWNLFIISLAFALLQFYYSVSRYWYFLMCPDTHGLSIPFGNLYYLDIDHSVLPIFQPFSCIFCLFISAAPWITPNFISQFTLLFFDVIILLDIPSYVFILTTLLLTDMYHISLVFWKSLSLCFITIFFFNSWTCSVLILNYWFICSNNSA